MNEELLASILIQVHAVYFVSTAEISLFASIEIFVQAVYVTIWSSTYFLVAGLQLY